MPLVNIFAIVRRIVVFVLGIAIILDGLIGDTFTVPELIIGMIMVGVLPIENLTNWRPFNFDKKELIDRTGNREIERKTEAPE
jgi:hypothetical protein